MSYTGSVNSVELSLELGESNVQFSSRWLLHQLIVYLDSHMLYKCVHKNFGTILFRKGIDVLISLSWALGMSDTGENYSEPTTKQHSSTTMLNEEQVLTCAGCIVNDIIHKEIKKQTSDSWLVHPTFFSINDYIYTNEITAERPLQYCSNAEEADNRMWRHATQSPASDILIYSPNTDVYNIGLHLVKLTKHQRTT